MQQLLPGIVDHESMVEKLKSLEGQASRNPFNQQSGSDLQTIESDNPLLSRKLREGILQKRHPSIQPIVSSKHAVKADLNRMYRSPGQLKPV